MISNTNISVENIVCPANIHSSESTVQTDQWLKKLFSQFQLNLTVAMKDKLAIHGVYEIDIKCEERCRLLLEVIKKIKDITSFNQFLPFTQIYENLVDQEEELFQFRWNEDEVKKKYRTNCSVECLLLTGIKDELIQYELLKNLAYSYKNRVSEYIDQFSFLNEVQLKEIAKICSENSGLNTAKYIKNYGIHDKNLLAELAENAVGHNPYC